MGIFDRFFQRPPAAPADEHAVITHLPLSNDDYGTPEEREAVHEFEARIVAALDALGGEHDGDEFGSGEAVLYSYGPDADALLDAIVGAIGDYPVPPGAYAIKRYGPPAMPDVREQRVELSPPSGA
jgi:hypothetical protein